MFYDFSAELINNLVITGGVIVFVAIVVVFGVYLRRKFIQKRENMPNGITRMREFQNEVYCMYPILFLNDRWVHWSIYYGPYKLLHITQVDIFFNYITLAVEFLQKVSNGLVYGITANMHMLKNQYPLGPLQVVINQSQLFTHENNFL